MYLRALWFWKTLCDRCLLLLSAGEYVLIIASPCVYHSNFLYHRTPAVIPEASANTLATPAAAERLASTIRLAALQEIFRQNGRSIEDDDVPDPVASLVCPIHSPQPATGSSNLHPPPPYHAPFFEPAPTSSPAPVSSPTQVVNNYYINMPSGSRHRPGQRSSRRLAAEREAAANLEVRELLRSLDLDPTILQVLLEQLRAPPPAGHNWSQYLVSIGIDGSMLPVLLDIVSHAQPVPDDVFL